jgi:hypothetical protein
LELYRAGLFDPDNREAAERTLAGMDFEGIDLLRAALAASGRGLPSDGIREAGA